MAQAIPPTFPTYIPHGLDMHMEEILSLPPLAMSLDSSEVDSTTDKTHTTATQILPTTSKTKAIKKCAACHQVQSPKWRTVNHEAGSLMLCDTHYKRYYTIDDENRSVFFNDPHLYWQTHWCKQKKCDACSTEKSTRFHKLKSKAHPFTLCLNHYRSYQKLPSGQKAEFFKDPVAFWQIHWQPKQKTCDVCGLKGSYKFIEIQTSDSTKSLTLCNPHYCKYDKLTSEKKALFFQDPKNFWNTTASASSLNISDESFLDAPLPDYEDLFEDALSSSASTKKIVSAATIPHTVTQTVKDIATCVLCNTQKTYSWRNITTPKPDSKRLQVCGADYQRFMRLPEQQKSIFFQSPTLYWENNWKQKN